MTIPRLTQEQIADLLAPLELEATDDLVLALAEQVERATGHLTMFFDEPDLKSEQLRQMEYRDELKRIAEDPARALDVPAQTQGAKSARDLLLDVATEKGIDTETRKGASAIGDYARKLLSNKKQRIDASFRMGVEQIFVDILDFLAKIAPNSIEALPSNEADPRCGATDFSLAFVQIVVDRTLDRLPAQTERAQDWSSRLLNKSHRALLDGLRKERQWQREHGFLNENVTRELTPGATYFY